MEIWDIVRINTDVDITGWQGYDGEMGEFDVAGHLFWVSYIDREDGDDGFGAYVGLRSYEPGLRGVGADTFSWPEICLEVVTPFTDQDKIMQLSRRTDRFGVSDWNVNGVQGQIPQMFPTQYVVTNGVTHIVQYEYAYVPVRSVISVINGVMTNHAAPERPEALAANPRVRIADLLQPLQFNEQPEN